MSDCYFVYLYFKLDCCYFLLYIDDSSDAYVTVCISRVIENSWEVHLTLILSASVSTIDHRCAKKKKRKGEDSRVGFSETEKEAFS